MSQKGQNSYSCLQDKRSDRSVSYIILQIDKAVCLRLQNTHNPAGYFR